MARKFDRSEKKLKMPILKIGMCPNLTDKVLDCLRKEGVNDVLDFVSVDVENLAKKSGISYKVNHILMSVDLLLTRPQTA